MHRHGLIGFMVLAVMGAGAVAEAQTPRGAQNPRTGGAPSAIEQSSRDMGARMTTGERESAAGQLLGRQVAIRPDATIELSASRTNVRGAWIEFEHASRVGGEAGNAEFDASRAQTVRLSPPQTWPIGPVLVVCGIRSDSTNGYRPTFRWFVGDGLGGEVVSTGTAVVFVVTHLQGATISLTPRVPARPWSLEWCELSRVD